MNCRMCETELEQNDTGRPPQYCSAACRQRAYRSRTSTPARTGRPPAGSSDRSEPASLVEREVPHLSERELLAWRGALEMQARILPVLDSTLRQTTSLTLSEFDVLYQLWRAPTQRRRIGDLARDVLVTPGGVTKLVTRLEPRGFVRRHRAAGRRAVDVELTRAGDREVRAAMDVVFSGVRRMFISHLDADQIDQLVTTWDRLLSLPPRPG